MLKAKAMTMNLNKRRQITINTKEKYHKTLHSVRKQFPNKRLKKKTRMKLKKFRSLKTSEIIEDQKELRGKSHRLVIDRKWRQLQKVKKLIS